jgi:succinyl-CoA synthetase beta subunit
MNFEEHASKALLSVAGINVPDGKVARTPDEAFEVASDLGRVVIKAQVPIGKRGKAGGIQLANTPDEARVHATNIIGMMIGGFEVECVLVEKQFNIAKEFYAAVLNDPITKGPIVMFSTEGGMDIEEIASSRPERLKKLEVDIRKGCDETSILTLLRGLSLGDAKSSIADILLRLFSVYQENDAELLEINPLVLTDQGKIIALDCKFVMDDSGLKRQIKLVKQGTPEKLSRLELKGDVNSIKYIELEGNIGVLANGAGLTMTTMDVIRHYGGKPANFCEIGGEAYTKAKFALELVLEKPGIRSLVVNFCGAFARCDVMMEGLLNAWEELQPDLPVFFSIAGTGDQEAIAMLKDRLGIEPFVDMDAASKAAVEAVESIGETL